MMRRLAWPVFGLWCVLAAVSMLLQVRAGEVSEAAVVPTLGVLAGVGALLTRRRPGNLVGPILLVLAVLVTTSSAAGVVDRIAAGRSAPSLAIALVAWFDEWVIFLWFGLVGILLPLLFPDGNLPSRRWRWLVWTGALVVTAQVTSTAFGSRRLSWDGEGRSIPNPLAVGGPTGDVLRVAGSLAQPAFVLVLLASLSAVVVRLRRSAGVERLQLKWFTFSVALLLSGLVAAAVGEVSGVEVVGNIGWTLFLFALIVGVPLAIGVAILRYRLYDIDMVIKRTLVYGSLTALLVTTYLGMVLVLRLVLSPVTGESDLAVAASTLGVAALFRPVRARIQSVVDRRFYRARYDAARTVEGFSARLRDQLDLEALDVDLRRVVADTVAPAHVSLWLRDAPR